MPGLLRGIARTAVIAGTATAVSNNVSRRQAGRWAAQEQQQHAQQAQQQYYEPPPAPPAVAVASVSMETKLTQLKELAQLKEAGVLNEVEFEQQKARILNA